MHDALLDQLRSALGRLEVALGEVRESMVWTDVDGRVEWCNAAFERLLGRPRIQVLGHSLLDLLPLQHVASAGSDTAMPLEAIIARGDVPTHTYRYASGEVPTYLEISSSRFQPAGAAAVNFLIIRDVTERETLMDELRNRALHDALTGLANRTLFADRVDHAVARLERQRQPVAVLFIDVDDFKAINDGLGHDMGDEALRAIAERIARLLRPTDTIARISGDEFAVLLEDVSTAEDADRIAERIVGAFRDPIVVGERAMSISLSIGIDLATEPTASAEEMLRNSDFAMYAAKRAGKGRWRSYVPADREAALRRSGLVADLRGAIERDELVLHYQPIVHLDSGQVEGFEALVRWQHPERGLLPPADFIGAAEESGLIVPMGDWVLRKACLDLAGWQVEQPDLSVSVNLSVRQLQEDGVVGRVRAAIERSGVRPQSLVLEVTESFLLADEAAAADRLRELRDLGVRVAFDDFGTGYSSLSHLRRLPVDVLKVDRQFVEAIDSVEGRAFLQSIVQLGRSVGVRLVAEGIERLDQIPVLVEASIESGQGFVLARPMPAAAVTPLVASGLRLASASLADRPS